MPTLKEINRHYGCFSSCGGLLQQPAGIPFRKFDEEVLRALRGLRPHPLPLALDPERTRGALRREAAVDTAVRGGEGQDLKEVGVEDDHGRSACSHGPAVKLHVEITFRS